ncbi:putative ABC transporter ATP-binding protein [Azospirillaceae bacterium]
MAPPLLVVEHLTIRFHARPFIGSPTRAEPSAPPFEAVRDVGFWLRPGDSLALIGERGAGKTTIALAVAGLLSPNAQTSGVIRFRDAIISDIPAPRRAALRGAEIALVQAENAGVLTPTLTIGTHLLEAPMHHHQLTRQAARNQAVDLLARFGVAAPTTILRRYPHQIAPHDLRAILIAMAMLSRPAALILDTPVIRSDRDEIILQEIRTWQESTGAALLCFTDSPNIAQSLANRAMTLYAGMIVESCGMNDFIQAPQHPYSQALLSRISFDGFETPPGRIGSIGSASIGCPYLPHCPLAEERCRFDLPPLRPLPGKSWPLRAKACHHENTALTENQRNTATQHKRQNIN